MESPHHGSYKSTQLTMRHQGSKDASFPVDYVLDLSSGPISGNGSLNVKAQVNIVKSIASKIKI